METIKTSTTSQVGKYLARSMFMIFLGAFFYFIYYVFFMHTLYVDAENNCQIDITPSTHYKNSNIIKAIEIVKANDSEYYNKLCDYVSAVDDESCGGMVPGYIVLGCAHGGDKIGIRMKKNASLNELASTVVHEVCHFEQGHNRKPEDYLGDLNEMNRNNENECYAEGDAFFNKVENREGDDVRVSPVRLSPYTSN